MRLFNRNKPRDIDSMTIVERVPEHTRRVTLKALTASGWLAGTIHLPEQARLVDFIERAPEYIAMTDVFMEAHSREVDFFALKRHSIIFAVVEDPAEKKLADDHVQLEQHSVAFLVSVGRMRGKVFTKQGVRLSDRMSREHRFVPVLDCKYHMLNPYDNEPEEGVAEFLLMSSERIVGFSERVNPA